MAIAPETPLRDADDWWKFAFVVTAEKDGDIAYVGSDWNEGITPWSSASATTCARRRRCCAARVFTDRGVYRLGEEVTSRRSSGTTRRGGIRLLPAGTAVVRLASATARIGSWTSGP